MTNGQYSGEYKGCIQKHGYGKIAFTNGDLYEGFFELNKIVGEGKLTTKSGRVYKGFFENDMTLKNGTLNYPNGQIFEGEFDNNRNAINGKIDLLYGVSFEGKLRNDQPFRGRYNFNTQGDSFYGIFENGKAYEGEYTFRNGTRTTMVNGNKHFGEILWPTGDKYEGDIRLFKPHGRGITMYKDGTVFEGTYERGNPIHGELTYKNKDTFTGSVNKYGEKHGEGVMTSHGIQNVGNWVEGIQDGENITIYPDGTQESNYYRHGLKDQRRKPRIGGRSKKINRRKKTQTHRRKK